MNSDQIERFLFRKYNELPFVFNPKLVQDDLMEDFLESQQIALAIFTESEAHLPLVYYSLEKFLDSDTILPESRAYRIICREIVAVLTMLSFDPKLSILKISNEIVSYNKRTEIDRILKLLLLRPKTDPLFLFLTNLGSVFEQASAEFWDLFTDAQCQDPEEHSIPENFILCLSEIYQKTRNKKVLAFLMKRFVKGLDQKLIKSMIFFWLEMKGPLFLSDIVDLQVLDPIDIDIFTMCNLTEGISVTMDQMQLLVNHAFSIDLTLEHRQSIQKILFRVSGPLNPQILNDAINRMLKLYDGLEYVLIQGFGSLFSASTFSMYSSCYQVCHWFETWLETVQLESAFLYSSDSKLIWKSKFKEACGSFLKDPLSKSVCSILAYALCLFQDNSLEETSPYWRFLYNNWDSVLEACFMHLFERYAFRERGSFCFLMQPILNDKKDGIVEHTLQATFFKCSHVSFEEIAEVWASFLTFEPGSCFACSCSLKGLDLLIQFLMPFQFECLKRVFDEATDYLRRCQNRGVLGSLVEQHLGIRMERFLSISKPASPFDTILEIPALFVGIEVISRSALLEMNGLGFDLAALTEPDNCWQIVCKIIVTICPIDHPLLIAYWLLLMKMTFFRLGNNGRRPYFRQLHLAERDLLKRLDCQLLFYQAEKEVDIAYSRRHFILSSIRQWITERRQIVEAFENGDLENAEFKRHSISYDLLNEILYHTESSFLKWNRDFLDIRIPLRE